MVDEIFYNFVVYQTFHELQPYTPSYGFVQKGDFSYFLYKETCTDCNIMVSISSQTNGGPDVFINKGLDRGLPSMSDYDFRMNTLKSEIIVINKNESDFLKNATSMADYYVIGVYGSQNTTFQISAGSSDFPIT